MFAANHRPAVGGGKLPARASNRAGLTIGQREAPLPPSVDPSAHSRMTTRVANLDDSATAEPLLQRAPTDEAGAKSGDRATFPWVGHISGTWSAALRRASAKNPADPHGGTFADLPEGTSVLVTTRRGGWLRVSTDIGGKRLSGYVSQELIAYDRRSAFAVEDIVVTIAIPSVAEAFVILKRAERAKRAAGEAYAPDERETNTIDAAIIALNATKKYVVDETTYQVTFEQAATAAKIKITTIEDFILFVEAVEKEYPSATPSEIVSEIRQLWYSDQNWEMLVSSQGVSSTAGGKKTYVDIETEPNPIAARFDMKDLAPESGSKQFDTRMGRVDVGHVMAGIDSALSGFPAKYPKNFLADMGHDDSNAELKYKQLASATGGDSREFTTWAGDLGQAYAEYLVQRFVTAPSLYAGLGVFIRAKMKPEEVLGDIHGYIAKEVWSSGVKGSPTGSELKASNILRDLYLVDKGGAGATYRSHVERVSGRSGAALRTFVTDRALAFARPWYAKKVAEYEGNYAAARGMSSGKVLESMLGDFDTNHAKNESIAEPKDKMSVVVDKFMDQLEAIVK
jgi:hypothetical protein